jgi:hypothetical protein
VTNKFATTWRASQRDTNNSSAFLLVSIVQVFILEHPILRFFSVASPVTVLERTREEEDRARQQNKDHGFAELYRCVREANEFSEEISAASGENAAVIFRSAAPDRIASGTFIA